MDAITIIKLLFVVLFFSLLLFLKYVYPNLRKPGWQRKIVSADYLRLRQMDALADGVLEEGIKKWPEVPDLYINYFNKYATPSNMKKLYDIISSGYEKTLHPGIAAAKAWCLIEEGEFDRAEEFLAEEDVKDYLLDHSMPLKAKLYFKKEEFKKSNEEFSAFYSMLYKGETDEKVILSDLLPEELIYIAAARRKAGDKNWKKAAGFIPVESVHETGSWDVYYNTLLEEEKNLKVETGIYGSPERLYNLRRQELTDKLDTLKEYFGRSRHDSKMGN